MTFGFHESPRPAVSAQNNNTPTKAFVICREATLVSLFPLSTTFALCVNIWIYYDKVTLANQQTG